MKKFAIFILASLMLATGLLAQKTPIVGVVDFQRVLADFTEYQSAFEKVRGSVAPVEEEIQRMQESIQAIVTEGTEIETKANNPAASEEARAEAAAKLPELQAKLQEAQVNLNQFRQQAQALARQGQQEDLAPLQEKARDAVKTVAKDKGIDIVHSILPQTIIYSSDDLEISDAVIALLNSGE
ncbi:MAG: OmpH family outer membrane protein [Verrucomicrobiota bacterium]|nr:OmpH family outer membrane protein [Verrucomicrobiota bacterium]MEC8209260.1 OmpH family outer membrane protein [Verrucomicrobiota bacterium]MEC8614012.1 OmpH family outer membrane protein [Verrucomicrobiota bacterium]MEE2988038.1 OmpH family outer membrane protein [Verrucomicrobiota bacterium]